MAALGAHANEGRSRADYARDALALLKQALDLLDKSAVSPDIGARLQEIIDSLSVK
jgi:hypothetical protein